MINDSEYVDVLVQIVRSTAAAGRPHITAAALGETLGRAVSDRSWKDFGYKTLGELLRSPSVERHLEVISTDKGALAVRPKPDDGSHHAPAHKAYNRLRKAVWGAFVMATPVGKRFLNKKTGAVRSGLLVPPAPYDEWVEITPISVDTQKAWAEAFLADATFPVDQGMRAALHQRSWNHAFSLALGAHGGDWNRFRSSKVAATVDTWSSSHGVSHDLVFQSLPAANLELTKLTAASAGSDDDDRNIILAALATLPVEQLRKIELPAGALLTVMRSSK